MPQLYLRKKHIIVCTKCDYKTNNLQELKDHYEDKHYYDLYFCKYMPHRCVCRDRFVNISTLKNHKRKII